MREFDFLKKHLGHEVKIVEYGKNNVTVECWDCNEVLMSVDRGGEDGED